MEPLISSSSRRMVRACGRSKCSFYTKQPVCREYTSTLGVACKTRKSRTITHTNISPRYLSPTTAASSTRSQATSSKDSIAPPSKPSAPPKTHYEFFPQTLSSGPPPDGPFVIDLRQLRREFLQLQAVAHPDRHPQELKSHAEGTSARINEAYKTLQNPLLRAQYLLSLRGIGVVEDETAKVEDPNLLMEVLDTRELIESAREEEELEELSLVNNERIVNSEAILEKAFKEDDVAMAKDEAVKLRYWINIKESVDAWERGKPVILSH